MKVRPFIVVQKATHIRYVYPARGAIRSKVRIMQGLAVGAIGRVVAALHGHLSMRRWRQSAVACTSGAMSGAAIDLSFVEAMEHAIGTGDVASAGRYLDENVRYTVGSRPALTGIGRVIAFSAEQAKFARWDGHTLQGWWTGEGVLVVEVISHFTRMADGRAIAFPCTDIYRHRNGKIFDWRVFADMSPFDQP